MAGLGTTAARGASVTLVAQGVRILIQLASVLLLSRILTPDEVGIVAMVMSVIGVADLIRDFGLSSGAIQAATLTDLERSNLFWVNVALGAGCSAAAALSAPVLGWLYHNPSVPPVTLALSWLFLISGASTQYRADLTRNLQFTRLAVIDIASAAAGVAAAVVFGLLGYGYWAIVMQQIVLTVLGAIAVAASAGWRPHRFHRGIGTRKFFHFGAPILGTNVLGYALNNVDNIGVGAVWGAGPVGIYSRAFQLLVVPLNQINAPMNDVVMPILARVQDDLPTFDRYVARIHQISCYAFGFALAMMAGVAWPLTVILLGPQWTQSAPVLSVLALGGIFRAVTMVFYQVYVARGLTGRLFSLYVKTRPFMMFLILGGLPWGIIGVAVGHLLSSLWFWAYSLILAGRITGLSARAVALESARAIVLVAIPAGLLAYLVAAHISNVWLGLGGSLAAGCLWVPVAALIPAVRRDLRSVVAALRLALPV